MASLKDLIVLGPARFLDKLYGNLEGNATTATKLQTARTINGTSFDGSGNITTSYWGTARNFTIGNTTKSVNGSAAVSWSLSEMGALPHFIKTSATNANSLTTTGYYSMKSGVDTNVPSTGHSMIFVDYTVGTPFQLYMHDATFTLYKRNYASNAWGAWSSTLGNSISGNAATATLAAAATKLATARSISLAGDVTGTTSFDGAGNVSITATVVDNSHNHKYLSGWADTRNVITTPNDYNGKLEVVGIKTKTGSGISFSSANTYATLVGIRGWGDSSGGNSHELAFDGNGDIYHRHGATTSWNTWKVIAHTDSDITGNAATATKLKTGNTINGTNFDGSTAITTSYWGTARTLTVGNTGKSVNGSGNVSWSIAEIGAVNKTGDTMSGRLTLNTSVTDHDTPTAQILVINCGQVPDGTTLTDKNAPGIGFHIGNNSWGSLILNGGNFKFVNSGFNGYMPVYASTFYGALSGNASSATKLQTPRAINGTNFDGTSAITTANWGTARTISISSTAGTTGTSVNGSTNVSLVVPSTMTGFSSITSNQYVASKGIYYGRAGTLPFLIPDASDFHYSNVDSSNTSGNEVYRKGAIKLLCANNRGLSPIVAGRYHPNSHGIFIGDIYSTSTIDSTTGLPQYSTFWASNLSGNIIIFGTSSYTYYERIVLDTSNYASYLDSRYINTAGDTMTGALNFANNTWNTMGDDAYIGDYNQAGMIGIKGKNGNTGIYFAPYSGSTAQTITTNGSGTMTISGTVASTFSGNLSGNAATATRATQDASGNTITTSYLRRYDWWTSGNGNNVDTLRAGTTFAYSNHNAPTTGTIVAFDCRGNENYGLQIMGDYSDSVNHLHFRNRNGDGNKWGAWRTVLDDNNYTSYTVTKTGSGASGTWGINITGNAAGLSATLAITKGGTGATTAAGARGNLGTMAAISANGYYGMGQPDGNVTNWIRTTSYGIIPYQSGGASALGTSSWPFSNAYINTVYGNLSGTASSATNADKLDGYHGSSSQTANTYVLRDGNGYIYTNYINSNTGNSENPSIGQIIVTNGSDNYYRKASLAHLRNSLNYSLTVQGSYTGSGGQKNPNYFGMSRVGFLMMNTTVNGNSNYKDWIIMDCYGGNDVGGGVALGVNRQKLGAYIMGSDAARTSWTRSAELYGTHNIIYSSTEPSAPSNGTIWLKPA